MDNCHTFRFAVALLLAVVCIVSNTGAQHSNQVPGLKKSAAVPTVFAEGVVSTGDFDSHPAFTPDGKTVYFLRSTPNFNLWTIVVSHFAKGRWSTPVVAPFSGQYADADPFITRDGLRFFFISNRPVAGKSTQDLDIWVMEKSGAGWGEPKNLGAPVNSAGNEWYPTLSANGTIYFGSDRPGGAGRTDIYLCRVVSGKYSEAENLGNVINTPANEFEALIAPDESYLVLMAGGRADGLGGFDLYVSFKQGKSWTKPGNLGF
jgi:WD40-like Beta Propeller Repeat